MQKETLELKLADLSPSTPEALVITYREKIADYQKKMTRHDQEKTEIEHKAKQLEKLRDDFQKHAQSFGMATIFLQIAILLSSISALLKKKRVWYAGMASGLAGLLFFADGFLLLF